MFHVCIWFHCQQTYHQSSYEILGIIFGDLIIGSYNCSGMLWMLITFQLVHSIVECAYPCTRIIYPTRKWLSHIYFTKSSHFQVHWYLSQNKCWSIAHCHNSWAIEPALLWLSKMKIKFETPVVAPDNSMEYLSTILHLNIHMWYIPMMKPWHLNDIAIKNYTFQIPL